MTASRHIGKGGPRQKSGRKPGSPNKLTREIAMRAAAEGITPLEVMLKAMREADREGKTAEAVDYAAKAAPYVHPRLNAVDVAGPGGGPIKLVVEWLS